MNTQGVEKLLIDALKRNNLKVTSQRMLLLDRLTQKAVPLSVPELTKSLSALSPNRTTVYRILTEAVKAKIVAEIHFKDGITRYESRIKPEESHTHTYTSKQASTRAGTNTGKTKQIRSTSPKRLIESSDDDHCHHVVCKGCGKVDHVNTDAIEEILKKVSRKIKGFSQVNEHTLEFFGFCTYCTAFAKNKAK